MFRSHAQKLLFRWVRLASRSASAAFQAACCLRPALGHYVCILHVTLSDLGLYFMDLASVLRQTPSLHALLLHCLNYIPQSGRSIARIAPLPAAQTLRVLCLTAYDNRYYVLPLLTAFPAVDVLRLSLGYLTRDYRPLPADHLFVELCVRFDDMPAPPDRFLDTVAKPWTASPMQVFHMDALLGWPQALPPGPSMVSTLRSLALHAWTDTVAARSALCPRLVELIIWPPGVLQVSAPLADTLPATLEHFAYPDGEHVDSRQGAAEADALAALPTRLTRLHCVSVFQAKPSWWTTCLQSHCAAQGIAVRHFASAADFEKVCLSRAPT